MAVGLLLVHSPTVKGKIHLLLWNITEVENLLTEVSLQDRVQGAPLSNASSLRNK